MGSHWRDMGSIPGLERTPLEDSKATHSRTLLGKSHMDSGGWCAMVFGVAQSWTRLKLLNIHTYAQRELILNKILHQLLWGLNINYNISGMWIIPVGGKLSLFPFPGSRLHPMEPSNNTQISEFLHLGISKEANYSPSYLGFSSPYTLVTVLGKLIIIFTVSSNSHIHTPMTFSPTCPL